MIKNKLGLGPVVAVALLIVVSVVAVLGFQSWFQTYSSSTFTSVETQSQSTDNIDIQGIIGNNLYIKKSNNENLSINKITIDGIDCLNIIGNHSEKLIELNVSDCLENITTSTPEIVVHTDTSILQEQDYYKGPTSNSIINTPLPIPRNGLVAEYLFENSSNLGEDTSGSNNHGTIYGGVTQVIGINGYASNFDGINGYLEPSTTFPEISSNKNWTYSINIKTTDYNAYLFNKGRYLNSADTNKIQISNRYVFVAHNYAVDYGNYTFYNNLILNNNWNNLVITYTDSNNLSVYVNSLLINSSIITDTAWADESGAFISRGLNNQHTDYALNGSMDNLRIYNRTLNITEIQALYEEGN